MGNLLLLNSSRLLQVNESNRTTNVSVNSRSSVGRTAEVTQTIVKSLNKPSLSFSSSWLSSGSARYTMRKQKGRKRRSRCRHVLVNSQGGVGSSAFMDLLKSSHVAINSPEDADGFKHKSSDQFRHTQDEIGLGGFGCASKAMIIVGDPLHSIESVHRRYGVDHLNKWRDIVHRSPYPGGTRLPDVWSEIARARQDTTGVSNYITSWLRATRERNWPELRLVTTRSLYEHAVEHAKYLGVGDHMLKPFQALAYRPQPFKTSAPPLVQEIFEPIRIKINKLEAET